MCIVFTINVKNSCIFAANETKGKTAQVRLQRNETWANPAIQRHLMRLLRQVR